MNFRTEIDFCAKSEISYRDNLMFIGSCFSENIGNYFAEYKFRTDINPFGILFNPSSIANAIERLITGTPYAEKELFFHNGLWNSFDHHGSFSHSDKNECLQNINQQLENSADSLKHTTILFVTFGTAWVYKRKDNGKIVANCHKMPENTFVREKLSVEEIVENYSELFSRLKEFNPRIKVIFTVSPIRHKKDGLHENQLSKSTLLLAINELQQKFDFANYFPSYEILMDDLRDYRFYGEDLVHPSAEAIKYIQEKIGNYFSTETKKLMEEIQQILKAENHRPNDANSEQYQKFLLETAQKKEKIIAEIKNIQQQN